MLAAERHDYGEVALAQRSCDALAQLKPDLLSEAMADAFLMLIGEVPLPPVEDAN